MRRSHRRRKMGVLGVGKDLDILLLGGGAIAIYFVGKNFGLWGAGGSGGLSATASSPTGNTSPSAASTDIATLTQAGQTPNYLDSQYAAWADTIFQAGNTALPIAASASTVLAIMNQLDDDIDVTKLIAAFGTRKVQLFFTVDLYQFINQGFTSSDVASFNQQLQYNGVSYRF